MSHKKIIENINQFKEAIATNLETNESLLAEINSIITELKDFFSKYGINKYSISKNEIKQFIHSERAKLVTLLKNVIPTLTDKKTLNLYYSLLVTFAELSPRNNCEDDKALCPILIERLSNDSSTIALSTGYLYDKASLLKWFEESKTFVCPATRERLSEYDIARVIKLKQGLEKIKDLEAKFNSEKKRLLDEQEEKISNYLLLGRQDKIKMCFLVLTGNDYAQSVKAKANSEFVFYQLSYLQREPKREGQYNFSNLNLSGLYFGNNNLIDPNGQGQIDLRGANLSDCIFLEKSVTGECLHADLTGANLEGAKFMNLPGRGVCIKSTNFTGANLKNVDFTGVGNWGNVNFTNANLTGAFLYDKNGFKVTGLDLKEYLKNLRGIESATFEAPSSVSLNNHNRQQSSNNENSQARPRLRVPTFEDFKNKYNEAFHSSWLKNPFSTMKWGLMFGYYRNMDDINKYAQQYPKSRTAQVLKKFNP